MKYSLVAAAVQSAVFLSLAGPAAAELSDVVLPDGNRISWEYTGEGDATPVFDLSVVGDQPMLLVWGNDVTIGSSEYWQSIKGLDQLALYGKNIKIYAAETDLSYQLNVAGSTVWNGAPATVEHRVKNLYFSAPADETETVSRLDLNSGFMAVESLGWVSGGGITRAELVLHGFNAEETGESAGNGAMLAVKSVQHDSLSGSLVPMNIRLEGNSVLVLGAGAYEKYANSGVEGVKKLKAAITDAEIQEMSGRASIVTSSPWVDGLGDGTVVSIGATETVTTETDAAKVVVGAGGRWILDLTADATEAVTMLADGEGTQVTPVTAQSGAELYLAGWNGEDFDLELDESWNDNTTVMLANSPYLSRIRFSGGRLSIERRPWSTMSGLAAREIAEEAESYLKSSEEKGKNVLSMVPIGTQFMRNVVMSVASVQSESLAAREIDDTVFLAGAAGLLKSVDNAQRRTHETILNHESGIETEANLYWWASAYMGHGSTDKLCAGNRRDSDEDFYGGTLGVDYRFTSNWIGTLAVSGATADIETPDVKKASLTMAAASASLSYALNDRHQLFAAATYSQTQGEATRMSVGFRARTEPEFRQLTMDIGWKAHYALESAMHVRPAFSVGWEQGRMRKGDIELSNQDGTLSDFGFEQSVDNRRVWHARGRVDVSGQFNVFGFNVEPGVNAGLTVYAGDTDWTVSSRLEEGTAVSKKSFHSSGRWHANGGLSLTVSDRGREPIMEGGIFGYGARNSGRTKPYDWCATVFGTVEAGAYGSRAASFGVRYREIF